MHASSESTKFAPSPLRRGLSTGLVLGALAMGLGMLSACERSWDFDCTAIWSDGPRQMSKKVYTYSQLKDESVATARCKEEMLESRPKGAMSARCKCVGK